MIRRYSGSHCPWAMVRVQIEKNPIFRRTFCVSIRDHRDYGKHCPCACHTGSSEHTSPGRVQTAPTSSALILCYALMTSASATPLSHFRSAARARLAARRRDTYLGSLRGRGSATASCGPDPDVSRASAATCMVFRLLHHRQELNTCTDSALPCIGSR